MHWWFYQCLVELSQHLGRYRQPGLHFQSDRQTALPLPEAGEGCAQLKQVGSLLRQWRAGRIRRTIQRGEQVRVLRRPRRVQDHCCCGWQE